MSSTIQACLQSLEVQRSIPILNRQNMPQLITNMPEELQW